MSLHDKYTIIILNSKSEARVNSLKAGHFHVTRKLFSTLQRKTTLLQSVALFIALFTLSIVLIPFVYTTQTRQQILTQETIKREEQTLGIRHLIRNDKNSSFPSSYVILSPKEINDIRTKLRRRKETLEKICATIENQNSQLNDVFPNIIIDTSHGISWCPVYKAASSTWMKHFAALAGMLSDTTVDLIRQNFIQVNSIVKQAFPHDPDMNKTYEKLNKTKKFLVVRHPLERLLSAYRDKLEHMKGREYYYRRFGRHIARRYRKPEANETKLEPTFTEFLQFIVKERYFDEHWVPYYNSCKPCAIHYDYILKFETFEKDQSFLIYETRLNDYLYQNFDLNNTNPYGPTTSKLLQKYLENVPKSLLEEVNKIYENDFKLFSYLPP